MFIILQIYVHNVIQRIKFVTTHIQMIVKFSSSVSDQDPAGEQHQCFVGMVHFSPRKQKDVIILIWQIAKKVIHVLSIVSCILYLHWLLLCNTPSLVSGIFIG